MSIQPIVDTSSKTTYACEALVRGPNSEGAATLLSKIDEGNSYAFDQLCRTTAIAQAAILDLKSFLSINFMPNAVYRPEACIRSTIMAAEKYNFPINQIIFGTVEGESVVSRPHLVDISKACKRFGF